MANKETKQYAFTNAATGLQRPPLALEATPGSDAKELNLLQDCVSRYTKCLEENNNDRLCLLRMRKALESASRGRGKKNSRPVPPRKMADNKLTTKVSQQQLLKKRAADAALKAKQKAKQQAAGKRVAPRQLTRNPQQRMV